MTSTRTEAARGIARSNSVILAFTHTTLPGVVAVASTVASIRRPDLAWTSAS